MEQVNNEKTMLALKEASTEVQAFIGNVVAEVEKIEKKYGDIVPIAETKEDYNFCKSVRKEVLPVKSSMEKAREALKRPVLDMGKLIDSSLKPLISRLESVYKPFEDAYREVDNRKKVAEEKRQAAISEAFNKLNDSALEAIGQASTVIETIIDGLADYEFDPEVFQERTDEAVKQHAELMQKLDDMLKAQLAAEDLQRRQAEIEAKEREERERLAAEQRQKEIEEAQAKAKAEADERHKREMAEAEERAKAHAEAAAKAERERVESERLAEEEASKKREADRKYRADIHNAILVEIVKVGVTEEQAKKVIKLAASGKAGNMFIKY